MLPILHLNGYKIANPTVLGRMSDEEIRHLFIGYGYEPLFVEGSDPQADAPADGGHARQGVREHPHDPAAPRATDARHPSARNGP